jgi:hypothetical protein
MARPLGVVDSLRWPLLAYVAILLSLIAGSTPRGTGDSNEYLVMAQQFAALRMPAVEPHFWFYSALAAPWVGLAGALGLNPLVGFTVLNTLLLSLAFRIAATRLDWSTTILLFAGPILWWVDKGHTEAFTFALLTIAVVVIREAPWWSMICLGAASMQNPPFALPLALIGILALVRGRPGLDRRVVAGGTIGAVLALLHPLYYQWHLSRPLPLAPVEPVVPTWIELRAVLLDLNIGLLPNFPALGLAAAVCLATLAICARHRLRSPELGIAAASAAVFLFSAAQTYNMNHGATPGMSRYGIWFIPLAIPLLQAFGDEFSVATRHWLVPIALTSGIWCLFAFHPRLPEGHLQPTRLAELVWTRFPALDNPSPEIFSERRRRIDGPWV